MSIHAGYGTFVQVAQKTINDLIRIYYDAGVLRSQFVGNTQVPSPLGGTPFNVNYELYLDLPTVSFDGVNPNLVTISLGLSGAVTLAGQVNTAPRILRSTIQLTASPLAQITPIGFRVGLDPATIAVSAIDIVMIKGTLPLLLTNFIQSAQGLTFISAFVSAALGDFENTSVPITLPTLGQLGAGSFTGITTRVLSDCLTFAADIKGSYFDTDTNETQKFVNTQGNPDLLKSSVSKSSIAIFVSSVVLPMLWVPRINQLNAFLVSKNLNIANFEFILEQGNFLVMGQAREGVAGEHAADFSLRLHILLGTPDQFVTYEEEFGETFTEMIPGSDMLVLDAYDVNIDPLSSATLGEILAFIGVMTVTFPAAPLVLWAITRILDELTSAAESAVEAAIDDQPIASLAETITLPKTSGPYVEKFITAFNIHPQGLLIRTSLDPLWEDKKLPLGNIIGPKTIWVEKSGEDLEYRFEWLQEAAWQTNPLLSIRWQAHRVDTGAVIRTQEQFQSVSGASVFKINIAEEAKTISMFKISCRVYWFKDLFNGTEPLEVLDALDKSFRFTSWTHDVNRPIIIKHSNGQSTRLKDKIEHRKSAIHRTDFPDRCSFANHVGHNPEFTKMNKLPFALEELDKFRPLICDYCFFGGPDKKELREDALAILLDSLH